MKERAQGRLEELTGKATGDKSLEMKGKARRKAGSATQAVKSVAYDAEHPRRHGPNEKGR